MDDDNFLIELAMTTLFFFDNFKLIFNLILFELGSIIHKLQNRVTKPSYAL